MRPKAARMPGGSPCQPTRLQAAIQSALRLVPDHVNQTRHSRELEAQNNATKEAERKAGKPLFDIPSPYSWELLHESSPWGDYLRAKFYLLAMPVSPPRAQIIAPAGIGKTRELIRALPSLADLTVHITVPKHSLVDQLVNDIEEPGLTDVHPVRGRTAAGMCAVPDIGKLSGKFANAGLSVQKYLCSSPKTDQKPRCPHYNECKYQAQRTTFFELKPLPDEPLVFVMPHQYLTRWPSFLPKPDLLVIDESHWDQFADQSTLKLSELRGIAEEAPPPAKHVLLAVCAALDAAREKDTPVLASLRHSGFSTSATFETALPWLNERIDELSSELARSPRSEHPKLQLLVTTRLLLILLSQEIELPRNISHSLSSPICANLG